MEKIYVFDVYGTLFDVSSLDMLTGSHEFTKEWRRKQIEYTWLLTLMGKYESFWEVTKKALIQTMKKYKVEKNIDELMKGWLNLKPWEDVIEALPKIKAKKITLTNGDRWMVEELLKNSNLREYFDEIYTVEVVKKYKPSKEVYEMVKNLGEIYFVSSNPFDIAGAYNAGLKTIYLNRFDLELEEINGSKETRIIKSLIELID